jgi:hypothetical protein
MLMPGLTQVSDDAMPTLCWIRMQKALQLIQAPPAP